MHGWKIKKIIFESPLLVGSQVTSIIIFKSPLLVGPQLTIIMLVHMLYLGMGHVPHNDVDTPLP